MIILQEHAISIAQTTTKIEDSYNYRGSHLPLLFGLSKFAQFSLCPSHSGHAYGRIKIEILSKLPTSPTPARTVCVKRITRGRQINADLHINVDSDRSTPININVSTDRCRSIDADLSRCRSLLMPIYWCRSYIEVDRSKPISIDDDIYRCIDRSVPICISADLYRRRCIDADLYWCCDTYRCK